MNRRSDNLLLLCNPDAQSSVWATLSASGVCRMVENASGQLRGSERRTSVRRVNRSMTRQPLVEARGTLRGEKAGRRVALAVALGRQ